MGFSLTRQHSFIEERNRQRRFVTISGMMTEANTSDAAGIVPRNDAPQHHQQCKRFFVLLTLLFLFVIGK